MSNVVPDAASGGPARFDPLAGVIAHDRASGTTARSRGLHVDPFDPTGAGDVFVAGLMLGTPAGWPVEHTVRLANLTAALSVPHFGGALAAPGWGDIALWWQEAGSSDRDLVRDYAFLDAVLPRQRLPAVSRAIATLGFRNG